MKRTKKYVFHKPIMIWFQLYVGKDKIWRKLAHIPCNRYENFVIRALLAMVEE